MNIRGTTLILLLFLGLVGAVPSFAENSVQAGYPMIANPPPPLVLTDSLMENFIAAATELNSQEKKIDFSKERSSLEELQLSRNGMDIIANYGFDITKFQQVAYSVGMAYAAEAMQGKSAEMNRAKQQLETMKGKIPDAQFEMMKQQMMQVFNMFADQPAGNAALVAKYRDQLQVLGN